MSSIPPLRVQNNLLQRQTSSEANGGALLTPPSNAVNNKRCTDKKTVKYRK